MNQLFKCIIVEDEELLAGVLKSYLEHFEQLELVSICKHPLEAYEVLKRMSIDLMFLDIEMPHISGIDFLKTLPQPPSVIFTTAYSEYAVKGFDHNAVDYLLKPIKLSRFLTAVNKFLDKQQMDLPEISSANLEDSSNIINIKSDGRLIRLKRKEITYIEGLREYVRYHLKNGEKYIVLQSLVQLEKDLPSSSFIRIHRSFIVNKQFVSSISGNQVLVNGVEISVSSSYRKSFMNWFLDV